MVTTSGPRKPHRQASNAFSMASNDLQRSNQDVYSCYNISSGEIHQQHHADGVSQASHHTADTRSNATTNHTEAQMHHTTSVSASAQQLQQQQQQKVCLETSFTNLHSPLMIHKHAHFSESISSSKASSLAGSVLSRSQISSIQCDISSVVENSIATVTTARKSPMVSVHNDHHHHQPNHHINRSEQTNPTPPRTKQVLFEESSPTTMHGNLQRKCSEKSSGNKPKSLAIPPLRRASTDQNNEDNWGVAPLASPETLSEISSISSRNSLGTSIDRHLHNVSNTVASSNGAASAAEANAAHEDVIFESQLHTPKVMRRAPKFTENLSTCAEDKRNLDQYKRMGRVFINHPLFNAQPSLNSSDDEDDSFESANSYRKPVQNGGSIKTVAVENDLEPENCHTNHHRSSKSSRVDGLHNTEHHSEHQQQQQQKVKQLSFSDSNILYDKDEIDEDHKHNNNITSRDDTAAGFHSSNSSSPEECPKLVYNIMSSIDTVDYYSANSSIERVSTNNHKDEDIHEKQRADTIIPPGVLESHFPLHYDAFTSTTITTPAPAASTESYKTTTSTTFAYPTKKNDEDHQERPQPPPQTQTVSVQIPKTISTLSSPSLLGRKRNKYCIYPSGLTTPSCVVGGVGDDRVRLQMPPSSTTTTNVNNVAATATLPEILVTNGSRPSKMINESTV